MSLLRRYVIIMLDCATRIEAPVIAYCECGATILNSLFYQGHNGLLGRHTPRDDGR